MVNMTWVPLFVNSRKGFFQKNSLSPIPDPLVSSNRSTYHNTIFSFRKEFGAIPTDLLF